jgi:hypothetical protein
MMTSDTDTCEVYWPPCSFPGNKAQNRVVVKEWHADVGGTFGRLDEKGNFVPEGDPTKVTHYKPPKGYRGYVSITVKIDDIPRAVDPATGEEVDTHNDEPPAVSDPAKLTVWEFEIDPPYIDARPVDQYREGQALYTFTATFEPGVDHNGNPMVTQIEFRLNSSREPGFCINATREEGSWTDTTANDNDLKFVPNQTGLEIRAPEGTTNYNEAIYIVPQPPPSTVTVSVRVVCLDYGAHGSITAIAYGVPSPKPPIARWKGTLIQGAAQIPKDQRNGLDDDGDGEPDEDLINGLDDDGDGRTDEEANGNGIWDGWEFEGPARDDNDAEPQGDGTLGDGLTRYEEYRGLLVLGEANDRNGAQALHYIRLNPVRKEIFVSVSEIRHAGYFPGSGMPTTYLLDYSLFNSLPDRETYIVNFYSTRGIRPVFSIRVFLYPCLQAHCCWWSSRAYMAGADIIRFIALNLYGVDKDSLIHLECQALVLRQLSIQRKSFEIAMTMKVLLAMLLVMKLVTVSFGINLIMVIMILDWNSA